MAKRQIKNPDIQQLLIQIRFTPQSKRKKELVACEELLASIKDEVEYPFDFVCFRITGHRPKEEVESRTIRGADLIADLQIFISQLSSQIAENVSDVKEKIYTVEELSSLLNVSTKTLQRWRKRGLAARKFIFEDGQKRFGFTESAVKSFMSDHSSLVEKAKSFDRVSSREKQIILKLAAVMAEKSGLSRYQIIEKISEKVKRSHETVRYTIGGYENSHPERRIFKGSGGIITTSSASEIFRLYKQGVSIEELTARFERSKSSIYRIINRKRARVLLTQKIEYIPSEEFPSAGGESILSEDVYMGGEQIERDNEQIEGGDSFFGEYLGRFEDTEPLTRDQEISLFRKYNYLKYFAHQQISKLHGVEASGIELRRIEKACFDSEEIKKILIESNLRLVISIASKHSRVNSRISDLVSEGNLSLMRAVENFDYKKGVRFATYASLAIAKDFARSIPAESYISAKTKIAAIDNISRTRSADAVSVEDAHTSLIGSIRANLNEREQYIIINHFGLEGTLIRKNKKTLKEIGDDLNLTKERVRQIELTALQKLKQSLSIEQFDSLTG